MRRPGHPPPLPIRPGDVVGRWTVVRDYVRGYREGKQRTRFLARCACGREQPVWLRDLRRGRSKGCRSASCRHEHGKKAA